MAQCITVVTPSETLEEATLRIMRANCCTKGEAVREARRQIMVFAVSSAKTVDDLKPVISYLLQEIAK